MYNYIKATNVLLMSLLPSSGSRLHARKMVSGTCILSCLIVVIVNEVLTEELNAPANSVFEFKSTANVGFTVDGKTDFNQLQRQITKSVMDSLDAMNANLKQAASAFASGDRAVQNDTKEQDLRRILAGPRNTQFFSTSDVAQAALITSLGEQKLEEAGLRPDNNVDKDGTPQASAPVPLQVTKTCVFDSANNAACSNKFREHDGRCTNLNAGKKTWGMAGTPYTRVRPARYEDGASEVRKTEFSSGRPLKSPRKISETVTTTSVVLNGDGPNAHIMQWGQFISHEFTLLGEQEKNIVCCPDVEFRARNPLTNSKPTKEQLEVIRNEIKRLRGHVCNPIENTGDTVFGEFVCMHHTRSTPSPLHDCSVGPRQQMNFITHVFDGSAIYGSSKKEADALRSFSGGKMKVQVQGGMTLPPQNTQDCPVNMAQASKCPFLGGDERINTTPNLIATHTMFLILHNKIATELATINPHWNDERLYQETRRIVAAIESNIHFYEYLPIVIGRDMIQKYRLGTYDGFDPAVNPSITNELAGAAMRYGHSLIDGFISLIKDNGASEFQNLRPLFNFPGTETIYNGGVRQCLRGLIKDIPWRTDNNFPSQMRNELFDSDLDIVSLNINRGRDHGFDSYMSYRRHYGLSTPRNFVELRATHPEAVVEKLSQAYSTVDDIELYIGGVTEKPVAGGLVGELFGNILGEGFANNRKGDRLFFQSSESGLKRDQIAILSSYNYNRLLCVGGELEKVPSQGFFTIGNKATEIACSSLPRLTFDFWKESIPNPSTCAWKITEVGRCCFGRRITKRVCEGRSSTCNCNGLSQIVETCTCTGNVRECIQQNSMCIFPGSQQGKRDMCVRLVDGQFESCDK